MKFDFSSLFMNESFITSEDEILAMFSCATTSSRILVRGVLGKPYHAVSTLLY